MIPRRVLAAGDWHGNTAWATSVIRRLPHLLPGEPHPLILHCGDFGIWPGDTVYLAAVQDALDEVGGRLWFVDGNHEEHPRLLGLLRHWDGHPLQIRSRIFWLPRGQRWSWHGRIWLACGGGVSLDKAVRTEGADWWPQEEITSGQERAIAAAGPADVLVSHDCPAGVTHTYPPRPAWWSPSDLARSDIHQQRLQRIACATQPSSIIHGHLHMAYQRDCDLGYGPVQVTGLDCDGGSGPNWAALDTAAMTWETP